LINRILKIIILRQFIRPLILAIVLMSLLSPYNLLFAQEDKVDLSLRLLPEYYYKEVVADKNTIMFMEVRNNGNTTITDISLSADKPEEWVVDIIPDSISYLSAGSSQTVDISIVPGSNIPSGEYTITLLAEATETRMAISTTLRVRNDSSFWVWIGIGVAALVAAGFLIIFLRFGRQ
jgi:uncharacterized membrane protein